MRTFLRLLPCVLALAGGCSGAGTSAGGQSSGGGSGSSGGGSSAGSGVGGSSAGTAGEAGSPSGGTSVGGTSCGPYCNDVVCEGENSTYSGIIKSCEGDGDCKLVQHLADCCGSILLMGINTDPGAQMLFDRTEMECTAGLPICECAPQSTGLEDSTRIALDDTNYGVACVEGQCRSVYAGATFACGDILCTETQYCTLVAMGPFSSDTGASCSQLGDCKSCDCLPASAGCGCSQDDSGQITISCSGP